MQKTSEKKCLIFKVIGFCLHQNCRYYEDGECEYQDKGKKQEANKYETSRVK